MLAVKYKSVRFGDMTPEEFSKRMKETLLRITVITGWVMPAHEATYVVMLDEFSKHLVEKYAELNPDEIAHAFRTRGTTVEDWGKQLNLNLIDKILLPYLHDRYQLSATEEKLNHVDDGYTTKSSLNWWRAQIETSYQDFLAGKECYCVAHMYVVLLKDGILLEDKVSLPENRAETVMALFELAKAANRKNLYVCE